MIRIVFLILLCTLVFAMTPDRGSTGSAPKVSTENDLFPAPNPITKQLAQARENGDKALYEKLLAEYKSTYASEPANAPVLMAGKVEKGAQLRWGPDIMIYNGTVLYDSWAVLAGIDDEAISVDYYGGDTLMAAVACTDSLIRVFRSDDQGLTWYFTWWFNASGNPIYEPEIICAPNGSFHVFGRIPGNNGSIANWNVDNAGGWYGSWPEGGADTVRNYTVCSDKSEYYAIYWLYLEYHLGAGGVESDMTCFLRSYDYGETWEPPDTIQFAGSGYPDITYGYDSYLFKTYYAIRASGAKMINTRRSGDCGNTWYSSVIVQDDTVSKMGPQIAAAHDGSGDAWIIWPRRNPDNANDDFGLWTAWSPDSGATWDVESWVNSFTDYHEVLPSIAVCEAYNQNQYFPYVTFLEAYYDWTGPVIYAFRWQTDSTWGTPGIPNDFVPALTRPIQTFEDVGSPAVAYVGEGGSNVYYDSYSNVGIAETDKPAANNAFSSTAYPNPFTTGTRIEYTLPEQGRISVKVYNTLGQEVATLIDGFKESGRHTLDWNGIDNRGAILPKGIYFLKIETPQGNATRKLIME